ncbi:MAG: FKBP-type peptidyl-prolyl cis-trans isomerase [Thermoleophilaceae bacterium]|nr:FKBP-type peptidyl-prolyl cis-trans isomerase [Thermoleophilaceae bacterium]
MGRSFSCVIALLALLAATGLAACGDDGDDEAATQTTERQSETAEEPSPSAQREALKDTSTKPVIPKPTGAPPRKLVKEDIVKGEGRAAKQGDTLTVNYVGVAFSTGEEFDASWDRGQPFDVPLGAGQVIEGWDTGLVGMRKGGRRMLTIPPELAYGTDGYPPAIAPNETLIFVVDAVAVKPGG